MSGKIVAEGGPIKDEGKAISRGDINGIVFDLDGILADASPDIAAALSAALREVG